MVEHTVIRKSPPLLKSIVRTYLINGAKSAGLVTGVVVTLTAAKALGMRDPRPETTEES